MSWRSYRFLVVCEAEGLNPQKVIENLRSHELPGVKVEPYRKDPGTK